MLKIKIIYVVIYCRWKKFFFLSVKFRIGLILYMFIISVISCFYVICREGRDEYNWRCFVGEVIDFSYVIVIRYYSYIF